MRFPLYIAKRYLLSKSKNSTVNIISMIAGLGVVVGAMSLFIVLSGFSGLKTFSLQFSSVFDADLKVLPKTGKVFSLTENQQNELKNLDEIVSFSKIIEERVFLNFKGKNTIAYIKGVDKNYQKTTVIDSTLITGMWLNENDRNVVVGFDISKKLSLGTFDYTDLLEIYVPKPGVSQISDPAAALNSDRVIVSGIYYVSEELNGKYVFSSFELAQTLLSISENEVSAVEIRLLPNTDEKTAISKIETVIGDNLLFKNRIQQNDALYKMLNTENLAVYLIFTLVMIIALFNVIASIIMIILDKKNNIKTLFYLGATVSDIRSTFYLQGVLMSVIGGIIGIVIGAALVSLQLQWGFVMITPSLPYPVEFKWSNVLVVFATITVLGIIASKIASGRVNEKLLS